MSKKQRIIQLNNQNGMTAGEVIIALLIILTTLGVVAMLYTNLVIGSREIDRKTGSTRIATNILENISMTYYDYIEENLGALSNNSIASFNNNVYTIVGNSAEDIKVFNTTIPSGYTVEITLENPGVLNLLKKVTVNVKYTLNNNEQNTTLSKIIEREQIRECNSPKFDGDYLRQLSGLNTDNSIMASENPENAGEGQTIICPIRYNGENYEIIETADELKNIWYSYSNRQWARVLLLTPTEFTECKNDATIISEKLKTAKSYVWIPRFGVQSGEKLFGNTYFKYKGTQQAILNSYHLSEEQNLIYNYVDSSSREWSTENGISFESNELTGTWAPYSNIENTGTDAYNLNRSQYGPLIEY